MARLDSHGLAARGGAGNWSRRRGLAPNACADGGSRLLRIRKYWQSIAVLALLLCWWEGTAGQHDQMAVIDVLGYWPMDEAMGDIVFDHGPGLNDGEIVASCCGSPTRVTGSSGRYVHLDGHDGAIEITLQEKTPLMSGSICFWEAPGFARSEQLDWQQIVLLENAQGARLEFAHGHPSDACVGPCVWFVWRMRPNQAYHLNCTPHDFLADEWIFWCATWLSLIHI